VIAPDTGASLYVLILRCGDGGYFFQPPQCGCDIGDIISASA
jgi:hypothetical protein